MLTPLRGESMAPSFAFNIQHAQAETCTPTSALIDADAELTEFLYLSLGGIRK